MFAVLALAGGAGFLLYLGLWVLIPEGRPDATSTAVTEEAHRSKRVRGLAVGLIIAAVLVGLFTTFDGFDIVLFFLLASSFTGIVLLNRRPENFDSLIHEASAAPSASAPPPPMPPPPPTPFAPPTGSPSVETPDDETAVDPDITDVFDAPLTRSGERVEPTAELLDPALLDPTTELTDPTSELAEPATEHEPATEQEPAAELSIATPPLIPPPPPDPDVARAHWAVTKTAKETSLTPDEPPTPSLPLASITLAAILAVVGVALVLNTLADLFVGAVTVSGISMAIIGLAVTVTSYRGSTFPLVPVALGSMVALTAAPTIDHGLTDGFGSKDLTVESVADLEPRYALGVGELKLDLERLELTEDTTVNIQVGTGGLTVQLPPDAVVEVHGSSTVGYVEALGRGRGGINSTLNVRPSAGTDQSTPRLTINADVTVGRAEIYRD